MKKIKIGLLGLGTVGTGVYKLIRMRADVMALSRLSRATALAISATRCRRMSKLAVTRWYEISSATE